jgi:ribosome-binding factor A
MTMKSFCAFPLLLNVTLVSYLLIPSNSFSIPSCSYRPPSRRTDCKCARSGTALRASLNAQGNVRSKRQERVGHLVRSELASILHSGVIKGSNVEYLEDELRRRISIVNADISPDLRQARVSISIRRGEDADNYVVDQRRAYSWLVSSTKAIKHSLAQRMSHMKSCPNLTFVQVNVGAAVDVMYLIDKISKGYKRETIKEEDLLPLDDEDDDWMAEVV